MIDVGIIPFNALDTWFVVKCPNIYKRKEALAWFDSNGDGLYALGGHTIWFNRSEDALMFTLKFVGRDD